MAMPGGGFGGYGDGSPQYGGGQYQQGSQPFYNNSGGGSPQASYGPSGGSGGQQGNNMGQGSYGYNQGVAPPGAGVGYDAHPMMNTGNHMSDVFFAAACCVVIGSLVGGFGLLLKPVDFLEMMYFTIFGGVLALHDTPWLRTIKAIRDMRAYIAKYVQFVTRITGKGVTLIFLGSSLFVTLWHTLEGSFLMMLAVFLCLFPTVVGFGSVGMGLLLSKKLNAARGRLELVIDTAYDKFANTYRGPQGGLTMQEFNNLTMENGGFKFETLELKLIFDALVSNPMSKMQAQMSSQGNGGYQNMGEELKISRQDLMDWSKSRSLVFL